MIKQSLKKLPVLCCLAALSFASCSDDDGGDGAEEDTTAVKPSGQIEIYDDSFTLLSVEDELEVLADGFTWSEGPLWLPDQNMLIFSDVPENKVYSWSKDSGLDEYLNPSGFTGESTRSPETGANGLTLDRQGKLIMCQHGDRRVARMNASLDKPMSLFGTIADRYEGRRFNSPNDLAVFKDGSIYFTDPPYGLKDQDDDIEKEQPHNGVYRIKQNGKVVLLDDQLTRPNGLAFSPDYSKLYVAQSDPDRAIWMAYDLDDKGNVTDSKLFYDATENTREEVGLPDGLKVHPSGYIFATGPGGVLVFSAAGDLVAKIKTGQATANCAFESNHRFLYMTADSYLMRVPIHGT